ncbi:NAD-dependent epimerase/dehydratase family protein [Flavobacteriaceae bacterium]|nr:NAD-dependent epimerase/dehydratase family protein [Flavobacteriaceae bacterium]
MKKVLLTGGYGFLGENIYQLLLEKGFNVFRFRSNQYDLRKFIQVSELFKLEKPDLVINAAARLGGIGDNQSNPVDYFRDNMLIGMNVLENSAIHDVNRVIQIGTVCSYPKMTKVPFIESDIWNGYPEDTNAPYGIAKRALISFSDALKRQYDLKTTNILLANLYGPGDDFRPGTSHVIPALIKKIIDAKEHSRKDLPVWGDGSPTRDFLFVKDAAEAIVKSLDIDISTINPINIASGKETSIKELVELLILKLKFNGEIDFDTTKPNGQPKRLLCVKLAKDLLNWKSNTNFDTGIDKTIDYYLKNKSKIDSQGSKY